MALSARQALAIKRSTATVNLWFGSVRSGKTVASIWAFLDRVIAHEGEGAILVIGLNRNSVWRNVFLPLFGDKMFQGVAAHIHYREGAPSGTIFGKQFHVVGASDESSWLRIQGVTVAIALGDEATGWPRSFWEMLETRLSLETSWLLATCNPGTQNHHLVEKVLVPARKGDPDYHVEKMLLRHNPFVPVKVKRRFDKSYTGVFRRRMIMGEWVAAEGAVFEDWDPSLMTVRPGDIPELRKVIAFGVDYGTNDETVGQVLALGVDGILYITDEWRPQKGRRLTDKMLVDNMTLWRERRVDAGLELPKYNYIDPAAASFKEEMRIQRITPHDADNDVINGISVVASQLSAGTLKISTSCKLLLEELPNYRWDPKAAERGIDKPIKENDHATDAFRYSVFSSRHIWRRLVKQPPLMA